MKITREDIKRFDDIRLIVLSALLGTSLSKFELDPSSVASPFIGMIFIMSVILAAYGVHTLSTAKNLPKSSWGNWYGIGYVSVIIILFMIAHFRGRDVTADFIGIDIRGMFLIMVTICAWGFSSLIIRVCHQRLKDAAEDTATKVVEEDK